MNFRSRSGQAGAAFSLAFCIYCSLEEVLYMEKIRSLWARYREVLVYLIFGGLTTLVNIVTYWLLARVGLATAWANGIALAVSILFAYVTNRVFVFESRAHGIEAWREFGKFIACRLGTGVLDQGIMVLGVDVLGPMVVSASGMELWGLGVKVVSNVIVIVLNYVFSKVIIFRKQG